MKTKLFFLLIIFLSSSNYLSAQNKYSFKKNKYTTTNNSIIIEVSLYPESLKDSVTLGYEPVEDLPGSDKGMSLTKKLWNGNAKWQVFADEPIAIYIPDLSKKIYPYGLVEPGDSIKITYDGKNIMFSGRGSEKLKLQHEIDVAKRNNGSFSAMAQYISNSVEDFWQWSNFLSAKLDSLTAIVDSYKGKISTYAYNYIRFNTVGRIEEDRLDKFNSLWWRANKLSVSKKSLTQIFDSAFNGTNARWMRTIPRYHSSYYAFVRAEVFRKYQFDENIDSLKSEAKRKFLYYEHGKRQFTGIVREEFFLRLIKKQTIYEVGFTPETELLLERYYAEPGFPEYKQHVKEYELKRRVLVAGKSAPDFSLTDVNGKQLTKSDLEGKVVLMDFWFTGCMGCIQMTPVLRKIETEFKNDSNVKFVSISTDADRAKWINSIAQSKYTTGQSTNLYTEGKGFNHYIIKSFSITDYPTLYLLDPHGRVVENPIPDPRKDDGEGLIKLIRKQLVFLRDGPYVLYNNSVSATSYSFNGTAVDIKQLATKKSNTLSAQTDNFRTSFEFALKPSHKIEPSQFKNVQKLFVLSDIEGNFDAFRRLLQANKVIDENYNWIFGEGHLVFCGDMFDRGNQVTECLWLIYSLEEKAKAAGGYVHYILGNHEIMNLSGQNRYTRQKYKDNAARINKSYIELYSEGSELGKWLRTKNIVEKIGDLLFLHAGISKEVIEYPLSIEQINTIARPYYDKDSLAKISANKIVRTLYDSKLSPFWHRLYYLDQEMKVYLGSTDTLYKTSEKVIDQVLSKFKVIKIVTGHTIVADTISTHYAGKVINTDTRHAEGKSEALLIISGKYYRVNAEGKNEFLF